MGTECLLIISKQVWLSDWWHSRSNYVLREE